MVLPPHIRQFTAIIVTSCGSGDETITTPVHTQIGNTPNEHQTGRLIKGGSLCYQV